MSFGFEDSEPSNKVKLVLGFVIFIYIYIYICLLYKICLCLLEVNIPLVNHSELGLSLIFIF